MTRLKFGFHAGMPSNVTGIGNYWQGLDNAGIPFVAKMCDNFQLDAQIMAQNSTVPHVLIFRRSVGRYGGVYDVPDYSVDPKSAALKHWNLHKAELPPEMDKSLVWIETINEVDKNRSEWLAEFALETAKLTKADGYKWLAFGWSSGEPEFNTWYKPKMQEFLRYCGQHPTTVGIALHEYSLNVNDIFADYPWLIGRFEYLFKACRENNIPLPTVAFTEWGWTYNNAPNWNQAGPEIKAVGEEYAKYPNILGAAIWALDSTVNWDNVGNIVNGYIQPLTQLTISHSYPPVSPPVVSPVTPPPSSESLSENLFRFAEANRALTLNKDAALQRHIFQDGFVPFTAEHWEFHEGILYARQGAQHLGTGERRVYFARVPEWNNVQHVSEGAQVPVPPIPVPPVTPPEPPTTPPNETWVDLHRYFIPDASVGVSAVMHALDGSFTMPTQLIRLPDSVAMAKGTEYERWRASGGFLERREDTSPGMINGRRWHYTIDDGNGWSKWLPLRWKVGDVYQRDPILRKFWSDTCEKFFEQLDTTLIKFHKVHKTWTSPANSNIVLQNVVEFHWIDYSGNILEIYLMAQNIGYVGWGSGVIQHAVGEIYLNRAPLPVNLICN